MTNSTLLVASMIMATNTTELKTNATESFVPPGQIWLTNGVVNYWYEGGRFVPAQAKDKWVVTEVVRVKKLQFEWNGLRTIEDTELISKTTNHMRLIENWQPVK